MILELVIIILSDKYVINHISKVCKNILPFSNLPSGTSLKDFTLYDCLISYSPLVGEEFPLY